MGLFLLKIGLWLPKNLEICKWLFSLREVASHSHSGLCLHVSREWIFNLPGVNYTEKKSLELKCDVT